MKKILLIVITVLLITAMGISFVFVYDNFKTLEKKESELKITKKNTAKKEEQSSKYNNDDNSHNDNQTSNENQEAITPEANLNNNNEDNNASSNQEGMIDGMTDGEIKASSPEILTPAQNERHQQLIAQMPKEEQDKMNGIVNYDKPHITDNLSDEEFIEKYTEGMDPEQKEEYSNRMRSSKDVMEYYRSQVDARAAGIENY